MELNLRWLYDWLGHRHIRCLIATLAFLVVQELLFRLSVWHKWSAAKRPRIQIRRKQLFFRSLVERQHLLLQHSGWYASNLSRRVVGWSKLLSVLILYLHGMFEEILICADGLVPIKPRNSQVVLHNFCYFFFGFDCFVFLFMCIKLCFCLSDLYWSYHFFYFLSLLFWSFQRSARVRPIHHRFLYQAIIVGVFFILLIVLFCSGRFFIIHLWPHL